MLSPTEVEGITAILRSLNVENLLAVANTTTRNMIKFETSQEATQAILTYTEKPSDFLRRKKITKEIIFNYLRSTGTAVSVNAEKRDYIPVCLKLWQSQESVQAGDNLDDKEESSEINGPTSVLQSNESCAQESQNVCALLQHEIVEKLAMEFLEWFFDSLNRLNNFGPHHFWPDCRFFMVTKSPPNVVTEYSWQNADCVAQAFRDFIVRDQLYFNPNIAKGAIKYEQEQHGLIKIAVGGVVHKSNNCVGLFDFFFGLIRDPAFNNNWKIKIVRLDSQTAGTGCVPSNKISTSANSLPMLA